MVDIRTVSLPGIWAEDAQTTIPTPPIANTTYRNLEWGETEANQGWPFQKIVDSADFNQAMWYLFTLQQMQEQFGILPWCSTTAYKQNGICLGSDGIFYWAKSDNTGVNPINDTGMTTWGIFLDPGDNFVTETVLTNQINLCEKLANKVQALSSSSTTTQYPSAKCVYDNITNAKADLQAQITSNDTDITNLQNNKQDTITGAASSVVSNNLPANRVAITSSSGKIASTSITTSTELGYLAGVTSPIQTQLNNLNNKFNNSNYSMVPNFSSITRWGNQKYTVPSNGWLFVLMESDVNRSVMVTFNTPNNVPFQYLQFGRANGYAVRYDSMIPLRKGNVITISNAETTGLSVAVFFIASI